MIAVARLAILAGIAGLVPEIATAADGGGIALPTDGRRLVLAVARRLKGKKTGEGKVIGHARPQ
ncbi:hypothetical protein Q666_03445 [Marinobacter sp. ES-1]|uniref:hypothetical protein n=1 Tax=Marinobacter sp. ES-1 TaxID=1396858 RepID=UPI0003B8103C|nr:hypothetical protein [Marinobacter sp. ES-1]ERP87050.1 hypothetical protein Q666_03445 [Marinobacter sp. ES-1]